MATDDVFDVCVIGTGAGGGVMLKELTAAGFRVVALQRGPLLTPNDFVDDELKVMIRPASALQVVGARMAEEFAKALRQKARENEKSRPEWLRMTWARARIQT